jgi:hypothetical protein
LISRTPGAIYGIYYNSSGWTAIFCHQSEHQNISHHYAVTSPSKQKLGYNNYIYVKGRDEQETPLVDNWELEWSSASRALMGDLEVKFCLPLTAQLARGPGNAEECQWAASAYTQA